VEWLGLEIKMVNTLARFYEETVQENIEYLKKLEKELYGNVVLHKMVHKALLQSARNLTKKWIAGEKYLRTKYARDAIPEYPKEAFKLSLLLDANINLMDDLLDETLSREERALYIVELLRVLALRDSYPIEDEVKTKISNYFNKIIFVAVSEQIFLEKMKDKEDEDFYEVAYEYFAGRSLDMDLFLEIPLLELKYKKKRDRWNNYGRENL
jgi:predicted nucleic acid-binding protein